jgi:hypothetical protein
MAIKKGWLRTRIKNTLTHKMFTNEVEFRKLQVDLKQKIYQKSIRVESIGTLDDLVG